MKRICLILTIILFSSLCYAEEHQYDQPLKIYEPIYFITGDKQDQVKWQISFKYALFYPFNTGFFVSYTETALWYLYDESSPFKDINHNPNIFWMIESKNNIFNNIDLGVVDYVVICPADHKSNGRDGEESRSVNRSFLQTQLSVGSRVNIGLNLKLYYYYNVSSKNKDYYDYVGTGESELFIQLRNERGFLDRERIYVKGGVGGTYLGNKTDDYGNKLGWNKNKYWVESGLSVRLISAKIQPFLFVQYYYGYGEFMLSYNTKVDHAIRAGITLK